MATTTVVGKETQQQQQQKQQQSLRPNRKKKLEKQFLAEEVQSERLKLTSSDRHLLKAFFGYTATIDSDSADSAHQSLLQGQKLKPAHAACVYVKETLFPDGLTEAEKERESKPFHLGQCIPTLVPSLFQHDEASLRIMFQRGRTMDDLSQTSMIRAHQEFSRLFTSELAVKQNGQTRIWISGSVSKETRTDTYTHGLI